MELNLIAKDLEPIANEDFLLKNIAWDVSLVRARARSQDCGAVPRTCGRAGCPARCCVADTKTSYLCLAPAWQDPPVTFQDQKCAAPYALHPA